MVKCEFSVEELSLIYGALINLRICDSSDLKEFNYSYGVRKELVKEIADCERLEFKLLDLCPLYQGKEEDHD